MKRLSAVVLVLMITLAAGVAVAQEPTDQDKQLARQFFDAGAAAYFDGDYPRAIVEFKKAYAHVEDPLILYNVSLAYLKLGNVEDALAAARSAGRDADRLPADDRPKFDARWAGLGRANTATELAEHFARKRAEETAAEEVEAARPAATVVRRRRFTALGTLGTGIAIVGIGALAITAVKDDALGPDLDAYRQAARDNDTARYAELKESLDRRQRSVRMLLGIGAGATLVGAVLLIADLATVSEEVVPVVTLDRGTPTFGFVFTY